MARNRNVMGPGPAGDAENREPEEEQPPRPGRPRPEPEPEPEPVVQRRKITLGSREFELDNDMAEALDAYRAESETKTAQQQRALEELYGRIPKPPEPTPVAPNFDTLIFEKPSEALRLYGEQIKADLQRQYQEDQAAQTQTRVMEKFWSDFYVAHPELKDDEVVVRSLFGANMNSFLDMTPAKAQSELAGMARSELTKIAARYQQSGETPARVEEGSRTRRGPGAAERAQAPAPGPKSLSEALKQRRAAMLRPIRREAG